MWWMFIRYFIYSHSLYLSFFYFFYFHFILTRPPLQTAIETEADNVVALHIRARQLPAHVYALSQAVGAAQRAQEAADTERRK